MPCHICYQPEVFTCPSCLMMACKAHYVQHPAINEFKAVCSECATKILLTKEKCYICYDQTIDRCYGCKKPICNNHMQRAIIEDDWSTKDYVSTTNAKLCPECYEREMRIQSGAFYMNLSSTNTSSDTIMILFFALFLCLIVFWVGFKVLY